ncbi:hypothetical protein H8E65_08790 [Candidatus Bathyarchaeota archaeon]|nr:hypothetical protein [Candidatus Bathyarchaeota archaeon]MBL7078919.1 hypothetical protein [Candidatus Bathyarchaeota archaeon]
MSRLLALLMYVASNQSQANGLSLGQVVLIVIISPVIVLLLATLLGKPRSMKVTGLFLAWLAFVFSVFIGAVYALSFITGLFI